MTLSNPSLASNNPTHTALDLKRIYRRITLRLIPFLMLLYLVAFLNRVNVSFAALTMNSDLGLSNTLFGIGAGIFFVGYVPFEVPSNFMLAKVGARLWLTVLLVLMGLVSAGFAFVHTSTSYMVMRFLLGAAESGFFPGVVLYLTFWLPASVRGGLMSLFIVSIPLSTVVGAPLSMAILKMNGIAGLRGWQWLFVSGGRTRGSGGSHDSEDPCRLAEESKLAVAAGIDLVGVCHLGGVATHHGACFMGPFIPQPHRARLCAGLLHPDDWTVRTGILDSPHPHFARTSGGADGVDDGSSLRDCHGRHGAVVATF